MADFLRHEPCELCGSSDGNAIYSDGSTYCFVCEKVGKVDEMQQQTTKPEPKVKGTMIANGTIKALNKREISYATCAFWNYQIGKDSKGNTCQIANYYNDKQEVVAQKVRYTDKSFAVLGDKHLPLYGAQLWSKENANAIIIVEGEIDALSVSQVYNNKRPVVSIPNGAQGAKKALAKQLDYLNQYETIILALDNDEVGRKAMLECASLFKAGSVKLCYWSGGKDANEMLVKGMLSDIHKNIKEAKVWRPEGIISSNELDLEELIAPVKQGIAYPYPRLQEMTLGSRGGELIIWTAGSGIGKSTILRELAYHFVLANESAKIGMIFLEENIKKTAQAFVALDNNIPLAILRYNPSILTADEWQASKAKLFDSGRIVFYKHFGSLESEHLLNEIRYMVVGLGVTHIFLDHISIAISGNESDNERKDIDMLMTSLRSLVEETGCHIDAIVHLKRTNKGSFNEGAQVSLSDLRGSGALEQLSDSVIALERNQQADGEAKDTSTLRILKNREIGITGVADSLRYNRETGRLEAIEEDNNEHLKVVETKVENTDF
jgi:DNA primase